MNWALHQQQVRFVIRAERAEYEYLFKHSARVLQDRLARLGRSDRTRDISGFGKYSSKMFGIWGGSNNPLEDTETLSTVKLDGATSGLE